MSRRLALAGMLALAGCTSSQVARTAARPASAATSPTVPSTTSTASTAPTPADLAARTATSVAASRSRSFSPAPTAPSRPEPGSGPAGAGGTRTAVVSWYGSESGTTASGQPFNPSGLTFANRTMPFGTRIRFCARGCVVATCTDRGPLCRRTPVRSEPRRVRCHRLPVSRNRHRHMGSRLAMPAGEDAASTGVIDLVCGHPWRCRVVSGVSLLPTDRVERRGERARANKKEAGNDG